MATVKKFLDRIQKLDMHRVVKTTLGEKRELMPELNRDQMMHGKRADGSDIEPPYTYFTRLEKKKRGMDPNVVTLYDRGDFHRGIYVDIGSDSLEIDSMDSKSDSLKEKYGESIFGLTNESKAEFLGEAFPVFRKKVESALKLEMK